MQFPWPAPLKAIELFANYKKSSYGNNLSSARNYCTDSIGLENRPKQIEDPKEEALPG